MTIDTNLLGEWLGTDGDKLIFLSDSSFYDGAMDVSYKLNAFGDTLNINDKSFYTRQLGEDLSSIIGHWRDNPNGEEITYRSDGRYISVLDGDPLVYFGTFTFTPTSISSFEYRGMCSTEGSQITFYSIYGTQETCQYTVTANTLLIHRPDKTITYNREISPSL